MRICSVQPPLGTPLNRSNPLSKGLVGCWLLNESGGRKAFNSSGYGIMNGAIEGLGTIEYRKTARGIALYSDGTSFNAINCGQSLPTQLSTPLSISCWFSTTTSSLSAYLMSHANFTTDFFGFELFMSSGKIFFYIDGSAGTSTLSTSGTYNDGKWHHAVGVADGTNKFIYVDGRQVATTAQTQTPSYSTLYNLYIGSSWDSNAGAAVHPWSGYLNNVMLWNRAIQSAEVVQLYINPCQMFKESVGRLKIARELTWYKFNNRGIRPRPFAPGIAR